MFLCYWHKLQVKGHEEGGVSSPATAAAAVAFLRREPLMVLHHIFVVAFCFPASVVTMATNVFFFIFHKDEDSSAAQLRGLESGGMINITEFLLTHLHQPSLMMFSWR